MATVLRCTSAVRTSSASSLEDLDNEEVRLAVENTPTYKRTSQQVKELQHRVSDQRKQVKQQPEEEVVRTIKF